MSDRDETELTSFNCYYGGKFERLDGQLVYLNGGVRIINAKAEELFTAMMNQLPMSLYGQRVWYKMPFDEIEDIQLLVNGSPNLRRMCAVTLWTRCMEIFVEPDIEGNVPEAREDRNDSEFQFEEEERVEREVVGFVYEDGCEDDYDTPNDSEGEREVNDYCKYKKGSGEIKLGQVFDTLEDFKEAVLEYRLKNSRNIHYARWDKDKSEVRCASVPEEGKEKCLWKIYCSVEEPMQKWMVKTYRKLHICPETKFLKILNEQVIAKLFVNDIREEYNLMPKKIQREIEKRWDKVVTIDQCRNARRRALDIIQKEHDEQFSRLRDYRVELLRSNEDSTVELETIRTEEANDHFLIFYVCFSALKKTWCGHCRPIFGMDGCFLKCTTKDQLLAAVRRDSNNKMYLIVWAVVDVESEDNWMWFISKLQTDLNLGDGSGFAIISDRQKGLLNVVSQLLPNVEHRMCARHIYANLKKSHPQRAEMKNLFLRVAKSYNKAHYKYRLDKVEAYDMDVFNSMMEKNLKNCSLAYFSETASCDDVSNNISEAFNHAINGARELPLVEMLETIRRRAMLHIEARRKKSLKHRGTFSLTSVKRVEEEMKKIGNCKAYPSGPNLFEVKEKNSAFMVDLEKRICACRKWQIPELPCRHALKVIEDKNSTTSVTCQIGIVLQGGEMSIRQIFYRF